MLLESKFRGLFLLRIGIGVFLFILLLFFCIYSICNLEETKKEALALALCILLFLAYLSLDLFKVYTLKIFESGFEKTSLISKRKEYIPFTSILSLDRQKSTLKNTKGNKVRDDYHYSILTLKNGKTLVLSPDNFENYIEIIVAIGNGIK